MAKQKHPKMIERIYEQVGPVYNFVYGKLLFNEGREKSIELLNIKKGHKVLEVGVGTGLTLPLYPTSCHVTGVDLSTSMLREAEHLMETRHIKNAEVKVMDATDLKFPDNHFDGVLGNLFISATTYPEKSLLEMKRVCKPKGRIVLMNHFKSDNPLVGTMERVFNPVALQIGFKSDLEMQPLLESVGLKAIEVHKVNAFGLWTAVAMENHK